MYVRWIEGGGCAFGTCPNRSILIFIIELDWVTWKLFLTLHALFPPRAWVLGFGLSIWDFHGTVEFMLSGSRVTWLLPISPLRITRTWGRMLSVFEVNDGVSIKIWTNLRWHVWFLCSFNWFNVYLSWDGWFIEWLTDLTHLWIWVLVVCTLKSSSSSNSMYGGFRVSNWAVLSAAHAIKLH